MPREEGLSALLEDPDRAAAWLSRRRLLGIGARGLAVPLLAQAPLGWIPAAWAEAPTDALLASKPGLRLLNDRPLNAETPPHLLDDPVTPAARLFVRNNGIPPAAVDAATWTLRVSGEACGRPRTFSIADLRREFPAYSYRLQLECGGNGRAEFRPRVSGNQWSTGAVGCPEWTGIRLRDLLQACGVRENAVYVAYAGGDAHLSGDPNKAPISRGVPLAKAMQEESLLAFAMNGEAIPAEHGAPLRMVCGGWPGSASGKWVTDILIRDRVHDGAKMTGNAYRVPCEPVAPGTRVPDEAMCIIESMPVKSLITRPRSGLVVDAGAPFAVGGHAWAGDLAVAHVEVSTDFGKTWRRAQLDAPANRLAWQQWRLSLRLPARGYHEIWARATDTLGRSQPMLVPGWNPKGYLNNAAHRIAVQAA